MKHILVVDDNKTNLVSAKTALDGLYKVTAVTAGAQALKFLEKNTCDLILLDLNMPEMDGFEVLAQIKQREKAGTLPTRNIPVLFLTADNDAEVWNRCIEEGAMDVIEKPFVKNILLSRIGYLLELMELRRQ